MMWGYSTRPAASPQPSNADRFSIPYLRKLHHDLVSNKVINSQNEGKVVEILRVIAEMVVYGDNNSEILFDFFCEKNMLSLFVDIMYSSITGSGDDKVGNRDKETCPVLVYVQVLQTLSILINCVRNDTSLYYLLSNNYINEILLFPLYNFDNESLRDQFASFLKSLSLRLNIQTVQFFFNEETGVFPLLTCAIQLLTSKETMVRIASQTTILNIYRINDEKSRLYALQPRITLAFLEQITHVLTNYYQSLVKYIRDYCSHYQLEKGSKLEESKVSRRIEAYINDVLVSVEDWLYYIADVSSLNVPKLKKLMINYIYEHFILQILLPPLKATDQWMHGSVYACKDDDDSPGSLDTSLNIVPEAASNSSSKLKSDTVVPTDKNTMNSIHDYEKADLSVDLVASLYFLNNVLKFIPDRTLCRAVLVTLFHPHFSIDSAELKACNQRGCHEGGDSSDPATRNIYAGGFRSLFTCGNERLSCLGALIVYTLVDSMTNNCFHDSNSSGIYRASSKARDSIDETRNSNEVQPFPVPDRTPESIDKALLALQLTDLISLETESIYLTGTFSTNHTRLSGSDHSLIRSTRSVDQTIEDTDSASASSIRKRSSKIVLEKECVSLYDIDDLSIDPGTGHYNNTSSECNPPLLIDKISLVSLISLRSSSNNPDAATEARDVSWLNFILSEILSFQSVDNLTLLTYQLFLYTLCNITRLIAGASDSSCYSNTTRLIHERIQFGITTLASKVHDVMQADTVISTESVLFMFQDELQRLEGQQWSSVVSRIGQDPLMMLPPTQSVIYRMGIENSIPTSINEKLRKNIQIFLLLICVEKHNQRLKRSDGTSFIPSAKDSLNAEPTGSISDATSVYVGAVDDVISNVTDSESCNDFNEEAVYRKQFIENGPIEMKGRKFLDAYNVSEILKDKSKSPNPLVAWFGISSPPHTTSSPVKSPHSSGKPSSRSSRNFGEILFLQDNASLIIVTPGATDGFFVQLITPLLHTDATVDASNKKRLKIIVRSWRRQIPCMERLSPLGSGDQGSNGARISVTLDHIKDVIDYTIQKSPCLLRPRNENYLWRMTIEFETAQSCYLACQHIERNRSALTNEKCALLQAYFKKYCVKRED